MVFYDGSKKKTARRILTVKRQRTGINPFPLFVLTELAEPPQGEDKTVLLLFAWLSYHIRGRLSSVFFILSKKDSRLPRILLPERNGGPVRPAVCAVKSGFYRSSRKYVMPRDAGPRFSFFFLRLTKIRTRMVMM